MSIIQSHMKEPFSKYRTLFKILILHLYCLFLYYCGFCPLHYVYFEYHFIRAYLLRDIYFLQIKIDLHFLLQFCYDESKKTWGMPKSMKVLSTIFPPPSIQDEMRTKFPRVEFHFFKEMEKAATFLDEAEIVITYGDDLTEELINQAKKLRWIMVMSAGIEKVPLSICQQKGILVTNARGIHKVPMAEYTLGMMLQYVKNVKVLRENQEAEQWNRKVKMAELRGKTILILGVGAIGGEIARLAKAFRMNTIGINRSGEQVDFVDKLYPLTDIAHAIPQADFFVSVLPSTTDTVHLLQAEHFCLMKDTAVFINIGRGNVVEECVLLHALKEKEIAHAILDVFEVEPLEKGHPFWKMENMTITPHLSSITTSYLPLSFEIFEHNLHMYIKNENSFINQIDFHKGY